MLKDSVNGIVFDIHRGTTHDGEGMRTSVFFKGCPLKCKWCHNPEGITQKTFLKWNARKCIGCRSCVSACPDLFFDETSLRINNPEENLFVANECPAKALTVVGKEFSVNSLLKESLKDEMFFANSGGGITMSGGEPMMQFDFIFEYAKELHNRGINVALDTTGFTNWNKLIKIYPYIDLFLYDIKLLNNEEHKKFTGVENKLILENLILLAKLKDGLKKIWIRTPLIPEATATKDNISEIGKFLINSGVINAIDRWELCTFNNTCKQKYKDLRIDWCFANTPLMTEYQVADMLKIAKSFAQEKAMVSGLTSK